MSDIVQWMKEQSPEKLREVMQGYPKHTDQYRLAELELHRKEAEQTKKESLERELLEQKRHGELVSSQKNSNINTDDHWYKKPVGIIAIAVTGGVLLALIKYALGI